MGVTKRINVASRSPSFAYSTTATIALSIFAVYPDVGLQPDQTRLGLPKPDWYSVGSGDLSSAGLVQPQTITCDAAGDLFDLSQYIGQSRCAR
jgi:hypothetical protein